MVSCVQFTALLCVNTVGVNDQNLFCLAMWGAIEY